MPRCLHHEEILLFHFFSVPILLFSVFSQDSIAYISCLIYANYRLLAIVAFFFLSFVTTYYRHPPLLVRWHSRAVLRRIHGRLECQAADI